MIEKLNNIWRNIPSNTKPKIIIGSYIVLFFIFFILYQHKTIEQVCLENQDINYLVDTIKSEDLFEWSKPVIFDKGIIWQKKVASSCTNWTKGNVIKEDIVIPSKKEIQVLWSLSLTDSEIRWIWWIWSDYFTYLEDLYTDPKAGLNTESLISPSLKKMISKWNPTDYINLISNTQINTPLVRWRVTKVEPDYSGTDKAILKLTVEKTQNKQGQEIKKDDFLYLEYENKKWYVIPDNFFKVLTYNQKDGVQNEKDVYVDATAEYPAQDMKFYIDNIFLYWPSKFVIKYRIITSQKFNKLTIDTNIGSTRLYWRNDEKSETGSLVDEKILDITNDSWWKSIAYNWMEYSEYDSYYIVDANNLLYFLENKNFDFNIIMKSENSNNFRLQIPNAQFDFVETL